MPVLTRYLVIKLHVSVDMTDTDQGFEDHEAEIFDTVTSDLDYTVTFDKKVEAGSGADDAIEVPVKIVDTEVVGMLEKDPT